MSVFVEVVSCIGCIMLSLDICTFVVGNDNSAVYGGFVGIKLILLKKKKKKKKIKQ
jgi:hypothetical protein